MKKLSKLALKALLTPLFLLLLTQCGLWGRISLSPNSTLFNEEVRRHIPVGSSVQEVKRFLELNDFACPASRSFEPSKGTEEKRNSLDRDSFQCAHIVVWGYQSQSHIIRVYSEGGKVTNVTAEVKEEST